MQKKISILIITYNRPEDLLELLLDIEKQEHVTDVVSEILILNNSSTVDYASVVNHINSQSLLNIRYVLYKENLGVARGRNRLLTQVKGDLILSIDDDMIFGSSDALFKLSSYFDNELCVTNNVGIVTFRVIYYDTKEVQKTAFPHKKFDQLHQKSQFLTYYFAGGAHIMRREVVQDVGIYTEDFHYSMEEYDLAYRMLQKGYTMAYNDAITVLHKESPLGRQADYLKVQMQWTNKSIVAWRYLPWPYYISTAFMWGVYFLKNCKGKRLHFFPSILKILTIPFLEKREQISNKALSYLKKVEARLAY